MAEYTTKFNLQKLSGSDIAGYNSINTLITSIDNSLYARVAIPGMIIPIDTSVTSMGSVGASTNGWTNLGTTGVGGLPTLSSPYVYIKKDA